MKAVKNTPTKKLVAVLAGDGKNGYWVADVDQKGTTFINNRGSATKGIRNSLREYLNDSESIPVYEGDEITISF